MERIKELNNYFNDDEIQFIDNNISKYYTDDIPFFQQITQDDNKIKFEFGCIIDNTLIDVTYRNNAIERNVIKISNILSIGTDENKDFFKINVHISEHRIIYYKASSKSKIDKLKQFADSLEEIYKRAI